MDTVYHTIAVAGVTLLVAQFLLAMIGIGHDDLDLHGGEVDVGHFDHDGLHDAHDFDNAAAWYAGVLSFRAIVAGGTIFGLSGIAASRSYPPLMAFLIAVLAGGGALLLVGWIMVKLFSMASDGTVRIENTLGATGKVYVTIPAGGKGRGKVTVLVQDRTVEYSAITTEDHELPTGAAVIVVGVPADDLLEVTAAVPVETADAVTAS